MSEALRLPAFTGCGIELEYMIVDRQTLAARPLADELLRAVAGSYVNDVERGDYGWSNELALHLVELKNAEPRLPLVGLPAGFQREIGAINATLAGFDAQLMPTAMHPFMDPRTELRLWPHEYAEIYRAYDRIFDTRRHGWANLQSMHVNLPFADDAEFARLHGAIRHVLPLLPALAASSPIAEGRRQPFIDFRIECYRTHADRVPEMMGEVIPEPVVSEREYRSQILEPMYRAIAPHDPAEDMRDEWLNARGAIARFDRHAIEIRVIDTQECPRADIAVAAATIALVRACYDGAWASAIEAAPFTARRLATLLDACARDGDEAVIADHGYLASLGFPGASARAGELWSHVLEQTVFAAADLPGELLDALRLIERKGPLARRILHAVDGDYSRERIVATYRRLCDCLASNQLFDGTAR
ncbi:MAG TPA: glutamate-cysteine ligase family protein [Steroidobacteraceae bacterium]|nr:glutamate-cysteine ligase family protein [Steroidobacteraceae bacterium]